MPLAAWRENSSRHVASLRRIRLVFFIAPVSSTITGRDYPQWTDLRKYVAELPVTLCLLGRDDAVQELAAFAAAPFVVGAVPGVDVLGAAAVLAAADFGAYMHRSGGKQVELSDGAAQGFGARAQAAVGFGGAGHGLTLAVCLAIISSPDAEQSSH